MLPAAHGYESCVEHICGSAHTFFTSIFAAQGKRQLNTLRNAEIKSLLTDLLGQDEIRRFGEQAGEVARLIKGGLGRLRQEKVTRAQAADRIEADRRRLIGVKMRVDHAEAEREGAHAALDAALARHGRLEVLGEQQRSFERQRCQLQARRLSENARSRESVASLMVLEAAESTRWTLLEKRIAQRRQQDQARRRGLSQIRSECLSELEQSRAVAHAVRRLALAQRVWEARQGSVLDRRNQVQEWAQASGTMQHAEERLAAIEREAGKAVLRVEELRLRHGLTAEVPCIGTDLQGHCKLLVEAHEAQALLPDARAQVMRLAQQREQVQWERDQARRQCEALAGVRQALARAEHRATVAGQRVGRMAVLAGKESFCAQAKERLASVEREISLLGPVDDLATVEELAEQDQITLARQAIEQQIAQEGERLAEVLDDIDQSLSLLPEAIDEDALCVAVQEIADARNVLDVCQRSVLEAVLEAQAADDLDGRARVVAQQQEAGAAHCAQVEEALANWTLFSRCMSNDGLIALTIDDAGPALSSLANELLLSCYGHRFSVAIHTLLQTAKGDQREGFDIVVHDGSTDEAKSLALMSGGERTWIEACLVRAVALYMAMHTGRNFTTLFTDEADGALDLERKRMFMRMKREVLRLGGYQREFFVTQTSELAEMGDVVIDLDSYASIDRPVMVEH